jgi:hypothetical protein
VISGVLLLLAGNLASVLWAGWLLDRLRTGRRSLDLVLLLLLRLLLISIVVLACGMTQCLTRWGLGSLSLAALAAFAGTRSWRTWSVPRRTWSFGALEVLTLLVILRLVAQTWVFAPHLGDAVAYHLPKIGEWVRAGGFTSELGLHPHVTFPAGFELVEAWWVTFLHHDALIEMAGVESLLLAFASVVALARQLGISLRGAWLAALIYVLTPGLHLSATSCLNDAPVAALVLATMALVHGRATWPLVIVAASLGIGTKATYVYALPGVLLLAGLVRREPAAVCASPRRAWVLVLPALAAGAFWFLRNQLWFGNPVFPAGAPGYEMEGVAVQVGPRWSSLLDGLRVLVDYRIYDQQTALGANVDDMAGWGPVIMACGLPGLAWSLLTLPRLRAVAAAFGISLASTLLMSVHDPWCLKYVFFFPALGALALAPLIEEGHGVRGVVLAALLFSLVTTLLPYDLPFADVRALWRQDWHERSVLKEPEPARAATIVACFGGFRSRSALLYRPDYSRRVVYLRAEKSEDFIRDVLGSGAPVLYGIPGNSPQSDALAESLRRGVLEPLGNDFYRIVRP